jgi:hypothetical protein
MTFRQAAACLNVSPATAHRWWQRYAAALSTERQSIWRFVTETALDLDATRRLLAEQPDAKLAELDAHRQHAATDAQRAQDLLTRVHRDYQNGQLTAAEWRELRDELTAELGAATALLRQLDAQKQRLAGDAAQTVVEDRVLTELAAIRASIMGRGTRRRQHWRGGVQNRFAATVPRLRACPGGLLADERPRRRGLAAGRRAPGVGPSVLSR